MAVEDAYELAYREAVRALEHQRAGVADLRNRASVLLAAGSIAVSLTGPRSLHGAQPLAWATLLCFALLSACVLAVVWRTADGCRRSPDAFAQAPPCLPFNWC